MAAMQQREAMPDPATQLEALWNAPVGLAILDRDLRYVRVNEALAAINGVPAASHVGKTVLEVLPEQNPDVLEQLRRVRDTGVPLDVELAGYTPREPGVQRHWRVSYFPVLAAGRVAGVGVTVIEVTSERRAQEQLRGTEEQRRLALCAAELGTWDYDPRSGEVFWDERFKAIYGIDADGMRFPELLGSLVHPDDRPTVEAAVERCLDPDRPPSDHVLAVDYRVVRPDGSMRWVQARGEAFFFGEGAARRAVRFIGTVADFTERQRVEEALRASEEKFRSVFEQAAIGMGRVRFSDARWIDVNDTFCAMLGYPRAKLLRTAWPDITHPDDVELDMAPFRRMARGEIDSYTVEKRFIHSDGRHVWARLTLSVVRDARGRPDYEIAIIEDIGDRKSAERALCDANARLVDADRRKNEFLAMLSHELRNPLAPIRNSLYVLDHAAPGASQASRAKDVIGRQVAHMARLIDDLLDVTRISRGKIQLRRQRVVLGDLVRRAAEDHRTTFAAAGVHLEVALCATRLHAEGDPTRLSQVVGNLLANAAKFTPRGGRVTLSLDAPDGRNATIRVRDDGAGIAPDALDSIFEPFVQGDTTLERTNGGLGLGLALVKALVELHGGAVRARSDGPGTGAEFVVTLPLDGIEGPEAPASSEPTRSSPVKTLRILVIEDNVDAAESLKEALELNGHEVAIATTGPEGIEKARAVRPDVVLCDIGLPGIDGFEVARRMRADAELRSTPLVALSGYAGPDDVERSRDAGFDEHMAKPPDLGTLESTLSDASRAAAR